MINRTPNQKCNETNMCSVCHKNQSAAQKQ